MKTLGEIKVRTSFNVSGDSEVDRIKKLFAKMIDDVVAIETKHYESPVINSQEDADAERIRIDESPITYGLTRTVIDKLEDTAMYYVKLLTA